MTHEERLPDTRLGAGLLTKLQGTDSYIVSIRDDGPIAQSKRADGQMGIKEKDESIERAQAREGTEEAVFVKETEGFVELGVPETIRGTELEHNLVRTYRTAGRDETSPLPEADGVFYFEASQEVPEGMPTMEAENGGYRTGYTWEVLDGDVSKELMNDHVVDLERGDIMERDISVYDLEYMETDEGVTHFNRPTALLEPKQDRIAVFRGGQLEYEGDVEGFQDFLQDEYGWDMDEVNTPATAKVQARMDAYGDQLGQQTSREFVNDKYMQGISGIGEAFSNFPEP